jgi:hypothetical protein
MTARTMQRWHSVLLRNVPLLTAHMACDVLVIGTEAATSCRMCAAIVRPAPPAIPRVAALALHLLPGSVNKWLSRLYVGY